MMMLVIEIENNRYNTQTKLAAKMLRYLCCLMLFILSATHATVSRAQFNMLFTSDNDLHNSLVNKIAEDSYGIMWIATEDGLSRYNGSRFKHYRHIPRNPNSLSSNFIRKVCTDKRGNVVVASTEGLQIYNRETDNFSPLIKTESIGLPTGNINDLCLLQNGDFLAAGLNAFTLHIDDNGHYTVKPNALSKCKFNTYNILEAKDGTIWVSYGPEGIWYVDKKGVMRCIKTPNGDNYNIAVICNGNDGKLYAGNVEGGLYVYNPARQNFDFVPGTERMVKIRDIAAMPKSNILCVATDGVGVQFFDTATRRYANSTGFDDPFIDISSQKAHSLYINENGDIWMALYQKGIFMATRTVSSFGYIGYRSQRNNIIGDRCVTSMVQRRDGSIWVSTDNGGLYGIAPDITALRNFPADDVHGLPMTLMGLFEDSRQRLWFGSYNHGCGIVDTNTGAVHRVPLIGVDNNLFSVYGYVEDKRGQIWVGSLGNGILRYDEDKDLFYTYVSTGGTQWTASIFYDSVKDIIFCGTYDGIVWFSPTDKSKKTHTLQPKTIVYNISRVAPNTIAFGTTNGLILLDTKTMKTKELNVSQGLPSNNIFAVQPGENGQLWMSTSCGLVRYDMKTQTMETYTVRDGLQGNEFYKNSTMLTKDGRIWFGGINGITYFSTKGMSSRQNLVCTSRVISLRAGEREIVADKDGMYVVPSGIDAFNIELATLPLYMTHRVVYYYKLDNSNWQLLPVPQNNILFDNLSYGKHTLYTKTVIDCKESEVTKTEIYVTYPWYLKWWMVLVWMAVVAAALYFVNINLRNRRRIREELLEHQREEEANEDKLQFFMNIVHDLRTPLTLIATPLQKLITLGDDDEHTRLYTVMRRNTNRLLNLTNEIMDLRKIDRGGMKLHCSETNIVRFISDIVNGTMDIIDTRHQSLTMDDRTAGNVTMYVDTQNFEKIIINLISNALKYTPEYGKVVVRCETTDEHTVKYPEGAFLMSVIDNGIGVPDEAKQAIFNRFYQIRTNDKHIKGSGIGLNLVKSLVELHHGEIAVSDGPDNKGTCFTVTLPLGKSVFAEEEISHDEVKNADGLIEEALTMTMDTDSVIAHSSETRKSVKRKTLLIIDDDDDIRSFLCEEMAAQYNILDCSNGRDAFNILNKEHVDIVVSDVMMPEIDGIELTKMIRQNVRLSHMPVILLTAKSSDQDRIEALQAAADAFVTKPFNIDLLQTLIGTLLMRHDKLRNTFKGNELPVEQIETPEMQSADERLMERLVKVINDNLSNPDLTSDILAREVGLSRGHLYRKLKELTNQSATNYIRNIRLTKAAELLSSHRTTVSEAAYLVGFRTPNHFSTAFKELYGMTPSEYVKDCDHNRKDGDNK